jgi:hypothetical protein
MYHNIPEELRALPQWICWRAEDIGAAKATKVPYDPKTGRLASVSDPNTWSDFQTAVASCEANKYSGIGFVFTLQDPYCFIDLDDPSNLKDGSPNPNYQADIDRQISIHREMDSYSEISPSGKGLHIIIKGKIDAGRKRSYIEVYSSARYATFTGNVYNNKPIADQQDKLIQLWNQMGGHANTKNFTGNPTAKLTDSEVIERGLSAANGAKFAKLVEGNWQSDYNSQSEADMAYIDIVAFYSQNAEQIKRIFRASKLGARDKAKREDYVDWMINKSFDQMMPSLDFDGFINQVEERLSALKTKGVSVNGKPAPFEGVNLGSSPSAPTTTTIEPPPGLLGEIAQFIYQAAPRPVPEIALVAAIGLLSGITGRSYNISGTGLNQYVLLLAQTGSGKESIALGIDKLLKTIRLRVPTVMGFIGPSEIASGQALHKFIATQSQCFVSILGEFGLRLYNMASQNAGTSDVVLRRTILDLYNKSGADQIMRGSIYADKDKNAPEIQSPAFSILGESTPETFYKTLNEDMIGEGLLPRFTVIEYTGLRPPLNKNHIHAQPSYSLIDRLSALAAQCETLQHSNPRRVVNVGTTPEAQELLDAFDRLCDSHINYASKETIRHLWNRAHMKVLKLSALIAVGVNYVDPIIIPQYVEWSKKLVVNDIEKLSKKFDEGEIGLSTFEGKQVQDVIRVIKEYLMKDWSEIATYNTGNQQMHKDRVIPYALLNKRLIQMASFRNDKNGGTFALKRCLQIMVDSDKIREVPRTELVTRFGTTQKAYIVSDTRILI